MASEAITELLAAWRGGDRGAVDRLMPLVYEQLRALAHRQVSGRNGRTLQTTALVHEAYLKLARHSHLVIQDRHHFFAVAAKAMRQLVVDHARRRLAEKRGGRLQPISIDVVGLPDGERAAELVALDEALNRLSQLDESLSRVVELRFFAGFSVEETATVLGCSPRTVKRNWRKARALLHAELTGESRKF
jgi:RNA polymerase sigma factor (TIGR02999 family)